MVRLIGLVLMTPKTFIIQLVEHWLVSFNSFIPRFLLISSRQLCTEPNQGNLRICHIKPFIDVELKRTFHALLWKVGSNVVWRLFYLISSDFYFYELRIAPMGTLSKINFPLPTHFHQYRKYFQWKRKTFSSTSAWLKKKNILSLYVRKLQNYVGKCQYM